MLCIPSPTRGHITVTPSSTALTQSLSRNPPPSLAPHISNISAMRTPSPSSNNAVGAASHPQTLECTSATQVKPSIPMKHPGIPAPTRRAARTRRQATGPTQHSFHSFAAPINGFISPGLGCGKMDYNMPPVHGRGEVKGMCVIAKYRELQQRVENGFGFFETRGAGILLVRVRV